MISATEEINKKLAQMNSKNQRLCTVLVTLFKPVILISSFNPLTAEINILIKYVYKTLS